MPRSDPESYAPVDGTEADRLYRLAHTLAKLAILSVGTTADAIFVLHKASLHVSRAGGFSDDLLPTAMKNLIELERQAGASPSQPVGRA